MEKRTKPITVRELIEVLQKLPAHAYVQTEGCDCIGPCSGAEGDDTGVVLMRDDSIKTP